MVGRTDPPRRDPGLGAVTQHPFALWRLDRIHGHLREERVPVWRGVQPDRAVVSDPAGHFIAHSALVWSAWRGEEDAQVAAAPQGWVQRQAAAIQALDGPARWRHALGLWTRLARRLAERPARPPTADGPRVTTRPWATQPPGGAGSASPDRPADRGAARGVPDDGARAWTGMLVREMADAEQWLGVLLADPEGGLRLGTPRAPAGLVTELAEAVRAVAEHTGHAWTWALDVLDAALVSGVAAAESGAGTIRPWADEELARSPGVERTPEWGPATVPAPPAAVWAQMDAPLARARAGLAEALRARPAARSQRLLTETHSVRVRALAIAHGGARPTLDALRGTRVPVDLRVLELRGVLESGPAGRAVVARWAGRAVQDWMESPGDSHGVERLADWLARAEAVGVPVPEADRRALVARARVHGTRCWYEPLARVPSFAASPDVSALLRRSMAQPTLLSLLASAPADEARVRHFTTYLQYWRRGSAYSADAVEGLRAAIALLLHNAAPMTRDEVQVLLASPEREIRLLGLRAAALRPRALGRGAPSSHAGVAGPLAPDRPDGHRDRDLSPVPGHVPQDRDACGHAGRLGR